MLSKWLLQYISEHKYYVEPFGGAASLLFAKVPAQAEVYNDIDSGLVNLFRVIRDYRTFHEFNRRVQLTPYSREEYLSCRANWKDQACDIEKARMFFVVARQCFGGCFGMGWKAGNSAVSRGMLSTVSAWLSAVSELPKIHQRLQGVQIENMEWKKLLKTYASPDYLAYVDPPYLCNTQVWKAGYVSKMDEAGHAELVEALLSYPGRVMLSCYDHAVYEPLESDGWEKYTRKTRVKTANVGRGKNRQAPESAINPELQARIECLYVRA
jgi:DNA adenine methylase